MEKGLTGDLNDRSRIEFGTVLAANGYRQKWGGRVAVEENGPRIFWYGIGYTMSEIMVDLPAANFNIN